MSHGLLSDSALDATESQKDLLGTSGLLFLLPAPGKSVELAEDDTYWLVALLQLKQLLQAKPSYPLVPLVVLVPSQDGASTREVEEGVCGTRGLPGREWRELGGTDSSQAEALVLCPQQTDPCSPALFPGMSPSHLLFHFTQMDLLSFLLFESPLFP